MTREAAMALLSVLPDDAVVELTIRAVVGDGTPEPTPTRRPPMTPAERARAYRERHGTSQKPSRRRDGPRDESDAASRENVTVRDGGKTAPPPLPHPPPSRSSGLLASSGSEPSDDHDDHPSRTASRTSRDAKRDVTVQMTCPPDLDLTEGQKDALAMSPGIPRWAVDAMVGAERSALIGKESLRMPLEQWRSYLSRALCGRWSDPTKRPKKPVDQAEAESEIEARRRSAAEVERRAREQANGRHPPPRSAPVATGTPPAKGTAS